MGILPAYITRSSNLQRLQSSMSGLARTNQQLFEVQQQISTRHSINRASDDPVKASAISVLNQRLGLAAQRKLNLERAGNALGSLDTEMGAITELVRSAQTEASGQIGITSDPTGRRQAAANIDSMLRTLLTSVNTDSSGLYVFGGSTATVRPVEQFGGGFRYLGRGAGLVTDLGTGDTVPITVGGDNAVGETSARLQSSRDLDPGITGATRLADLNGAAGTGIGSGSVAITFNGGPTARIDLSGSSSIQDVINKLTIGIRKYETDNGVAVLNAGGITPSGSGLSFDLTSGGPLVISNVSGGTVATDLGLSQSSLTDLAPLTADLNPKLTFSTPVSTLSGVTLPLGSIRVKMTSGTAVTQRVIDLSGAQTMDDVRATIEGCGLGLRVQVNEQSTGINVLNEVGGVRMSIEEVAGGANTASELGIRSLDTGTRLADFNGGRGVRIATGGTSPTTGLPDPSLDTDFRITLGNGQSFDVDLRTQDTVSVQTLLARINAQFAAAVGQTPINPSAPALTATDFTASLTDGANGIAFTQTVSPGAITVQRQNNSAAAEDLGLLDGTYDSATSTFLAQDRAGVRVNNLFSDLIDLRDALLTDNSAGITVAGERLAGTSQRINGAAGTIASYGQRIDQALSQLEERTLQDTTFKSDIQDLDFAEAASRFSLLSTQLEASLRVTGQVNAKSLFDYLSL